MIRSFPRWRRLSSRRQEALLDLIERHKPDLLDAGRRIAKSEDVKDREVQALVGLIGETNNALHGRDEGPTFKSFTAIYDAISREYWGIGRRVSDFEDRTRRLETREAAARMDAEYSAGVQVSGTVIGHEASGMFVDVGWSVLGLVLHGMFPNHPSGPRDFPELGSRVVVEMTDIAPRERQVYMRLVGPDPEFSSTASGTNVA